MIKTQDRMISGEAAAHRKPRLTALEKAMLRWAIVDPDDRLLDANVGNGKMAEYLRRNMQCDVCGVSDRMEDVRSARSLLRSSDIVYAAAGEIPWRDESFDTVLMKLDSEDDEQLARRLAEAMRVLRPGGQLILGAPCYPKGLSSLAGHRTEDGEQRQMHKKELWGMVSAMAYRDLSWQRTGLGTGVMIAWKDKPSVRRMMEQ